MRTTALCAAFCLVAFPALAMEEPFMLLCEYGSGDFQSSKDLKVNVEGRQVDDQNASFTDTMITFDRTDEGKNCHYEINRLNSDFTYSCQDPVLGQPSAVSYTGRCKRAPPRQF